VRGRFEAKANAKIDMVRWGGPITSVVWLFFLISPIHALLSSPHAIGFKWIILAQVAVFVALYLALMGWNTYRDAETAEPAQLRKPLVILVLMVALTMVMTLMAGLEFVTGLLFTSAAAGAKLPTRWAAGSIGILEILALILHALLGGSWLNAGQSFIFVLAIGLITMGASRLLLIIRELEVAREEVARLAAAEERLHLAREMHDLLGHSLSLIAVKSELARQLVVTDAQEAVAEIVDIERVSRSALADVRKAVSGYRHMSLAQELAASREILAAAKIAVDLQVTDEQIPTRVENVIAWTVREGVTNVVRHGHALRCAIRIEIAADRVMCTIENDSRDTKRFAGMGVPEVDFGNGLSGLSERVRAQHGQLAAILNQESGYILSVSIPVEETVAPKEWLE